MRFPCNTEFANRIPSSGNSAEDIASSEFYAFCYAYNAAAGLSIGNSPPIKLGTKVAGVPLLLGKTDNAESFARRVTDASRHIDSKGIGDDNVYIQVNGKKVWPTDADKRDMGKGDVEQVNYSTEITNDLTITIVEHDKILWLFGSESAHDTIGEHTLRKGDRNLKSDTYFVYSFNEKSIFLLDLVIDSKGTDKLGTLIATSSP